MDEKTEKYRLIQQMGSGHNATALQAVKELRERRWHRDGTLQGAKLSGVDLSEADLSEADLSEADLFEADLIGANLIEADLNRADLSHTLLSGANLSGATLSGATLSGAILEDADLTDVECYGTTFADVDLSTVKGLETVYHLGPSYVDIHVLRTKNWTDLRTIRWRIQLE